MATMGYIGFEYTPDGFIDARGAVADAESVRNLIKEGGTDAPSSWEPSDDQLDEILGIAAGTLDESDIFAESIASLVEQAICDAANVVRDEEGI